MAACIWGDSSRDDAFLAEFGEGRPLERLSQMSLLRQLPVAKESCSSNPGNFLQVQYAIAGEAHASYPQSAHFLRAALYR